MKLLLDHNLPSSLVELLTDLFPHSQHVHRIELDRASDLEIRDYAKANHFLIVTKDADFSDLCVMRGFPPKIVWIRRGNCSSRALEQILRERYNEIEALNADSMNGVLTLF